MPIIFRNSIKENFRTGIPENNGHESITVEDNDIAAGSAASTTAQAPTPPAKHKGWYRCGRLPHFDCANTYQVITYRLADSLPKAKLQQLELELSKAKPEHIRTLRRKKIEKWLDAGHGSSILRNTACAEIVIDAWKYFDGIRYDLIAWVVMPNHVHVLAHLRRGWPLGQIVNSWKCYTARRINEIRRLCEKDAARERGAPRLWQRGYWDRYIRDETHFTNAIEYIENNPVTAGLVKKAEDWPFSNIGEGASRDRG